MSRLPYLERAEARLKARHEEEARQYFVAAHRAARQVVREAYIRERNEQWCYVHGGFEGYTVGKLERDAEAEAKAEAEVRARAQAREELRAKGPLKKRRIFV